MERDEQRLWLIRQLLAERKEYGEISVSADAREQKDLLRALMNVRPPRSIDRAFLDVQDAYLTAENAQAGVVDASALSSCPADPRLVLWQGDITTLRIDAIVNAANSGLTGCYRPLHNCIDNCIHSRAGIQLRLKCAEIMEKQGHEEPAGQAKITPAYNLPCKFVLHTVGPIVEGRLEKHHCELLASCYRACLKLAEESGCEGVAFCCISTGVFGFPKREAAEIAVRTVKERLEACPGIRQVVFNVFGDEDREIYRQLLY